MDAWNSRCGGSTTRAGCHVTEQITRDEVHPEEAANSLLITLVRCRNLPVMDTGVFGGSSDPYCIIKVGDEQVKSTVRKKDLNPVWVESFELPNSDKDAKVVFEVLDYDAYGTSDPIGRFLRCHF